MKKDIESCVLGCFILEPLIFVVVIKAFHRMMRRTALHKAEKSLSNELPLNLLSAIMATAMQMQQGEQTKRSLPITSKKYHGLL